MGNQYDLHVMSSTYMTWFTRLSDSSEYDVGIFIITCTCSRLQNVILLWYCIVCIYTVTYTIYILYYLCQLYIEILIC